jgi:hypothetical protein
VCITTVGFTDMYPTTTSGRIVVCVAMYSGVLVLTLPISVMGFTFPREYDKRRRSTRRKKTWCKTEASKPKRVGLLAIISSSSCAIDEEEESDSKHNYESDDDDDFNNSEWELEKCAIRNDGVLVRKTPIQLPSGSGDAGWGAIPRVATRRDSAESNAGSAARRSFSSTPNVGKERRPSVSQSNGQPQQRRASRRQSSSDSKDHNHSYQSIDGVELMLLQQQLALQQQQQQQQGRPVSFGLGVSDRPHSGHVTASLLRDDGTGAISAASDVAGFSVSGSSRLVRCGDVLSQSERQAVYHRLSSLHGERSLRGMLCCVNALIYKKRTRQPLLFLHPLPMLLMPWGQGRRRRVGKKKSWRRKQRSSRGKRSFAFAI